MVTIIIYVCGMYSSLDHLYKLECIIHSTFMYVALGIVLYGVWGDYRQDTLTPSIILFYE
jgi:hypothetical protein